MAGLDNAFVRAKHVARVMLGKDLYSRRQLRCRGIRLGNKDAPWCVCPCGLTEGSTVYSFGVGDDISFDVDLIARFGVRVHAFDPTPGSVAWIQRQKTPKEFIFHDYGIGCRDGLEMFHRPEDPNSVQCSIVYRGAPSGDAVRAPVYRLRTIMQMLGHEKIDVLKMDIEGAEYGVIADLIACRLNVRQLLVEFHHRWPEIGLQRTREAISGLNQAGFRLFDVSPGGAEYSFLAE